MFTVCVSIHWVIWTIFPLDSPKSGNFTCNTPKSSFGLLTKILLGFKSLCDNPFHEEMLEHQEYPAQVVEWLIHTGKLHQKIKWTCIFDPYVFKPKIINSIMMQLSLRQIPFTWTTLGWFNFIRNFASFFISSSST